MQKHVLSVLDRGSPRGFQRPRLSRLHCLSSSWSREDLQISQLSQCESLDLMVEARYLIFQGGEFLFTFPATPIKCAGAPQKVCYLADDVSSSSFPLVVMLL